MSQSSLSGKYYSTKIYGITSWKAAVFIVSADRIFNLTRTYTAVVCT
jgi:hypothetical protein